MTGRSTTILRSIPPAVGVVALLLLTLSLWAFWPTLADMATKWIDDPQYSHGYLVPLFALVLLWQRSEMADGVSWGFHTAGLVFFAAAFLLRCGNVMTRNIDWVDGLAFVCAMAGLVTLIGGWDGLLWAWPGVTFLVFMIPLPYTVERSLGADLQSIATTASTAALQLLGLPAVSEGNVILLNDRRLGVAEACSGLSMLLIFIALSVAFAAVVKRPFLDRIILVASSVPIALLANIIRITVTGALHVWVGSRIADLVFHDLAGWLMMPLALGLLWLEMKFLSYVLVDEVVPEPMELAFGVDAQSAGAPPPVLPWTGEHRDHL